MIARFPTWQFPDVNLLHALGTDEVSLKILRGGVLYPCQAIFLGQTIPLLPTEVIVSLSLLLSVCLSFVVPFTLLGSPLQQEGKQAEAQQQSSTPVVKPPLAFGLEDGTPVKLRTNRTVSSADAHVNDTLDFEVLEEVKVHDVIVIPRGGIAWTAPARISSAGFILPLVRGNSRQILVRISSPIVL
jgi:hypothetical protein